MAVQVSYPGVYIQEVRSGARTITGVSTAIAAFVGMATRGPLNEPTRVFGFTDYERIFSDDISMGEMTDQVRQFFFNGGQQAFIMRVADGAVESRITLLTEDGNNSIGLEAVSAGLAGDELRVTVDYDTASPERTFNLTVFRESEDAFGNVTIEETETLTHISLDPSSPRFIRTVLDNDATLVRVPTDDSGVTLLPTDFDTSAVNAISSSAVVADDNFAALAATLPDPANLRVRIGAFARTAVVTQALITSSADFATALQTAIQAAFQDQSFSVTVSEVTVGSYATLQIQSDGGDVSVEGAAQNDMAPLLGFGVANGGIEVGRWSHLRPAPSGFATRVGTDPTGSGVANITRLLNFAASTQGGWPATVSFSGTQPFSIATPTFTGGTTFLDPAGPGDLATTRNLRTTRANLLAIAEAIAVNESAGVWRPSVVTRGYRLELVSTAGTADTAVNGSFGPAFAGFTDGTGIAEGVTATARGAAMENGANGTPPGSSQYAAAFETLEREVDLFNILVLPRNINPTDESADARQTVWGSASVFAQSQRAFLLVDLDRSDSRDVEEAAAQIETRRIGVVNDHAAAYWPRLRINVDGETRTIDPSGSIAGIMSRIDSNRGVWKAPAGTEADVRGITGVDIPMSDNDNGVINPLALNAIRVFRNGIVSWGARTMDGFDNSGNDDYKYVPVRRFALFIEESLYRGLQFAVFEPNDEPLWSQLRLAVGAFMNNLFRQGAFAGRTTREAYFVKVDAETTTQNDINLGIVNVIVGFAPLKPAEFVIITLRQQAGQVQV